MSAVASEGADVFELIRRHDAGERAVLCAFDLLELDGKDLRRRPIEKRKALLAKLLKGSHLSIVLNEHFVEDGANRLSRGLPTWLRGDRIEADRLDLSVGAIRALAEGQKSESASGEARSRGGLGQQAMESRAAVSLTGPDDARMFTNAVISGG